VAHVTEEPARAGTLGEWPVGLSPRVVAALRSRGVERPWWHQSEAWSRLLAGRDVAVVSPTASGKSLCYHVPVLQMLVEAEGDGGSALYLYPTKALSQDQCAELNVLLDATGLEERAVVYDGDTPAEMRRRVREGARLVITNPDMLHASVLPNHARWRGLLATLRWVVIDEMHMYRGMFGSHVANVLQRLQRLCRLYGSFPRFVLTSATIANPGEQASRLIGREVEVVEGQWGARGPRTVMLYNPPMVDAALGIRQSPGGAATFLAGRLIEEGHRVIVFTRSRQGVELIARRLQEQMRRRGSASLADRIAGYRGGYLPEERRRIERGLRAGEIQAVVSTNALELGIDIGSLDVAIVAGYPGTIASFWQQAGRAGRRGAPSLVLLVGGDDPVDQYLMQHPDYLLGASPEHARLDPRNLRVTSEHLRCALFEHPFAADEAFGTWSVAETGELIRWWAEEMGLVGFREGAWRWQAEGYPAQTVSLRALADENFVIVERCDEGPQLLGELDFESAHLTVYPQAIYQHGGRLYEVQQLDHAARKAWVARVEPDYFTQAIAQTFIFVLSVEDETQGGQSGWGDVRVLTRVAGFKKIRLGTRENVGYGEVRLPDLELHTTGAWWLLPEEEVPCVAAWDPLRLSDALTGASRALHTVALVHVMCAPEDLRATVQEGTGPAWEETAPGGGPPVPLNTAGLTSRPGIFLVDRHPGGAGFSDQLHALGPLLLRDAAGLLEACGCLAGCPACAGPPLRPATTHRDDAALLLRVLCQGLGGG
jgi:DEAD/DEAH box helicase domain-containing protein